jgi:hypothetical protein
VKLIADNTILKLYSNRKSPLGIRFSMCISKHLGYILTTNDV